MMDQEKLIEFNKRGLIHAPDESDENFFRRALSAGSTAFCPESPLALKLYDINPDWVKVIYDNEGLRAWEGGCTHIERGRITLQLNKAFLDKEKYFGYSREEVFAHELVHAVRGNFEEPIFEEMLAYQTSSSPFRRYFGPAMRSTKETLLFVIVLALSFFSAVFSIYPAAAYLGVIGLLTGGSLRLFRAQRIFRRTKKKLEKIVGKEKALPVMLRLTDREIIRFSKMTVEEILAYSSKMCRIQIRWQQISFYFSNG